MRRKIAAPILPPTIAAVLGEDAVKKNMKNRGWLVR
jgi:hypothetical protein